MTGGKKWLVILTDEQHNWIKSTAQEIGVKGSDIVREMLERVMNEDSRKFKASLANTQLKVRLQTINDKRAALDEEVKRLKGQLSEKIAV